MPSQRNGAAADPAIRNRVTGLLRGVPSFRQLDGPTRRQLTDSLAQIAGYMGSDRAAEALGPLASQMAPNLRERLGARQTPASQPGQGAGPQQPAKAPAPSSGTPGGPTGRVGEVARSTLGAIDFPSFVASLIQGTFQSIVDASIQQMEAYAEMLKNVASTVDSFMDDNITDGTARDFLADQYGGVLRRDTSGGSPALRVARDQPVDAPLPSFFKDLGFDTAAQIDDDAVDNVIVPAARRSIAERRQSVLATMVLMGMNRVVVDDGEISAKLMFHIDASESMGMRFDQTKTTGGNMSGHAGRNPFSAQAVMVNTVSLNTQSDINVRADLTGQVKVRFRSETFPLERFADSAAIQLINSNAAVPGANPTATTSPGDGTGAEATPGPQSGGAGDPWTPRA